MSTQEIITRLLRSLGSRKEVEQYLKLFASRGSQRFAVIQASGSVVSGDLESLASSIGFLSQIGLTPLVVVGAGDELLRDASPETTRRWVEDRCLRLSGALEELGTRARPVTGGVFHTEGVENGGEEVVRTRLEPIDASLRAGSVAIISSAAESRAGQLFTLPPEIATDALALALEPLKIVFLDETGGMKGEGGQIISAINLAEDYGPLLEAPFLGDDDRARVTRMKSLLDRLPPSSSVSITSPDHLARELFTHRGSGTLVKQGERVELFEGERVLSIDKARLADLLEQCFQRALLPGYLDDKRIFRVYLADSYRATAILKSDGASGVPYLCKFAVTQEAQGAGVGASIWQRMRRDNPKLFWRSRVENPVNGFYFEQSGGSFKSSRWTVFWYGLDGYDEIRACVEEALAMAPSLTDRPPPVTA